MPGKHFFFDFDETLVDTSKLRPYRQTNEGKNFVAANPDNVETYLIDERLVSLINNLAGSNKISITTNSPRAYAQALLIKHGFLEKIPIYWNLHKPCHEGLECAIDGRCDSRNDAIAIGDSASDILAAHGCRIPAIAVPWGRTSDLTQLNQAEPNMIVQDYDELEESMEIFERGEIFYQQRRAPSQFTFLDPSLYDNFNDPDIQIIALGPYYPTGHDLFYNSQSNQILRFKEAKEFSWQEIREGAYNSFFLNGRIQTRFLFRDILLGFYNQLKTELETMDLADTSYMIAAPNSAPEYCYKLDVNQLIANNINRHLFNIDKIYRKRGIFRVFPKKESHADGNREETEHFKTIGIKNAEFMPANLNNLLIFDDVTTSHSQIISLAVIVRELLGFDGNIYGIVLGQTQR